MSEPTKPGYYWAKYGPCSEWQIVEVFRGSRFDLRVSLNGAVTDRLQDFTFGPEVTKPEDLE